MSRFFGYDNRFFWYGTVFFYMVCIVFVIISLLSYTPTDSSLLYVSSDPENICNKGGFLGAHLAAFLFYCFGGASFLCIIPLVCGVVMVIKKRSYTQEWERVGASLYIVLIGAALLATYQIDSTLTAYPGGKIGMMIAHTLLEYCDVVGRMLFLWSSLCAALVLLFRWSFMFLVQSLLQAFSALYMMMKKHQVIRVAFRWTCTALYIICIYPLRFFITFVQSLGNGTAFEQTGLLHPEEDEHYDDDVLTLLPAAPRLLPYYIMSLSDDVIPYAVLKEPVACVTLLKNDIADNNIINYEMFVEPIKKSPLSKVVKKNSAYALPHMNIFVAQKYSDDDADIEQELQERAQVLQDKLKRFGVHGHVVAIKRGPVVTLFEYQPDIDTKLSKIIVLEDDLAMALQAMSIRIIAPIPGRSVVGFEVANSTRRDVLFSHITKSAAYTKFSGSLPLVLGKDTIGDAVVVDLARMPHLLIAGSTGSGKSVALNAILISLLCKLSPDDLKLILIDPKRLEFAAFTDIAHLLFPIVTSPLHAAPVLRWVVQEMEQRYEKMAQCGARNITDYNQKIYPSTSSGRAGELNTANSDESLKPLPFIVVIIDELADLMITAGRDIEDLITRITQMARAAGIHMIVATQRPSVDVITGLIKANFPSRISFRVASRIDSRTILDTMGADRLLGRGDMLFLDASTSQLRRVHGAYVSDQEIEQVADHIRHQRKVEYLDIHQAINLQEQDVLPADDLLYKDVREFLNEIDEVSISLLQRRFRIGYNRSARIIDMLESQGLIMPQDGGKTRKVIR
jgi:S-DNA-T family DNA segregation ATPase FtsK/SpoIIIE